MKRIVLIIGALFLIGAIGYAVYAALSGKVTPAEPSGGQVVLPPQPAPVAPAVPLPTGETFSMTTPKGVVEINNFYVHGATVNDVGDATITGTKAYRIGYVRSTNQFIIFVTDAPFAGNRAVAEQALLDTLAITKDQACKLNVVIRSSWYVEDAPGDEDLPLSFCKNKVQ